MPHEYETKLNQLREKLLRENYVDAEEFVSDFEAKLTKLVKMKKLATNPLFISIAEATQKRLNDINALLMNDETLTDMQRQRLFGRREELRSLSNMLNTKSEDSAIAGLLSTIDERLAQ